MEPTPDRAQPEVPLFGPYDANGVDLSLLKYTLSLSPLERLVRMEQAARDTRLLNEYGRQHLRRPKDQAALAELDAIQRIRDADG